MMGANDQDSSGRRVVVTGMGIVTTIGESLSEYLSALIAGRSGITRWKHMDERSDSKIGGDMSDFDVEAHVARVGKGYSPAMIQLAQKLLRATPLSGRLTAAAALQAFVDAGMPDARLDSERLGHVLAGHNLNMDYIVQNVLTYHDEPDFIDPLFGLLVMDTDVLSVISELLTVKGPSFTVGNACASGNLAVLAGLDLIRSGRADAVIVSGGAFGLDPMTLHGWAMIEALSCRSFNEEPARASRPFDTRREGFVPSEGAGALVLETLTGARKRGARMYAELLGAASTSDASRLTKPHLDGQVRVIHGALRDARITPEQIDYINAHATSTPLGDAVEVAAIKAVFGDHAYRIPINATKSMLGHCLTAAGVVELVATILQMANDVVHPTINQEEQDSQLDLDFVPNEARQHRIEVAISNAFGFGGLNSCVVVGRAP
jgi:3-oxoacyl-(acyl-carrier-protein) synthase